jgi:hypothetical protein
VVRSKVAHRVGGGSIAGERECLTAAAAEIELAARAGCARLLHPGGAAEGVEGGGVRPEIGERSLNAARTRQGLGKYTRIRRRDYPKLTRFVKRIPTCLGHVCCTDLGEDSETNRGFFRRQATNAKVMGTSRGERLVPLRTDDVANRAQHWRFSVTPQQDRGRGAITNLNGIGHSRATISGTA